MSITFQVIDLSCQQAEQSFFVPVITMTSKSTTKYATLYGFNEIVNPSSPPKKYRKATVSGYSSRIGFTAEETPRQCAGGKYVWSGTWEVDLKGKTVSKYKKQFFAQCPKQFWPEEAPQSLPGAIVTSVPLQQFVAFCWSEWPQSCSVCPTDETTWNFLGDQATGFLSLDLRGFYALNTEVVATKTSWSINVVHNEITSIITGQPYTWELFGTDLDTYVVTVGSRTYYGRAVITDPPNLVFPSVALSENFDGFTVEHFIKFTDTSIHSATLSEEYTDADALTNAQVVIGTGTTAQTTPRTTGFTSVFTSVVYTLKMANLISGKEYLVEVDLWRKGPGTLNTHTPKQYGFIASGETHTITDVVPTPVDFQTITVQKPKITFAPV